MRRLILFRHAKAEGRAPGGDDAARALDLGGRADASVSGRWLAANGLYPNIALVSSSRRTHETWECVADFFPDTRLELRSALYDAVAEEIEEEIQSVAGQCEVVLVIAHNPGLQELAVSLLSTSDADAGEIEKVAGGFPTSTIAVFRIDESGRAALESLFNPRRDTPPPFIERWDEDAESGP